MKQKVLCPIILAALWLATTLNLPAQGTAIFYQGRLNDSGVPANTNYDLRFAVFNAPVGGANVSVWLTNSAVPVSNGLFSVTLDFGPGVFNGTSNGSNDWLDISVRLAGTTSFTSLTPRQAILPVPYAQFANSASNLLGTAQASQITGTIPASLISGAYTNTVNFSNGTNTFTGAFTGNGGNLTNLNASQVAAGTLADARLSGNVDLLNANQSITGSKTFGGTVTFNGFGNYYGTNYFNSISAQTSYGSGNYYGVNIFSNNGNFFVGSFFGNGLVGWLPVYGTATNAMRDAGYLMLGSGLGTVTLPATASLSVGDIVRVSGGGGIGWLVQENTGQAIVGNFARYANGTLLELPNSPTVNAYGVAASADGVRMYAVGGDILGVYASSDSGRTWGQVGNLSGYWNYVACSADGKTVYAQPTSGFIQKSVNAGAAFFSTGIAASGNFISCTADGSTLITGDVACVGNGTYRARLSGGAISVSTNGGASYSVGVSAPAAGVFCLGASGDCSHLVAGVSNGLLYASSNLGATWTSLTTSNQVWSSAWMSPDGSKIAATISATGGANGSVYTYAVSPQSGTISTNSSIGGSQGSAVELQYIGNNQFMPVSSTGILWAN